MHSILHSVYLKHDTSFKSLTKQALAQIILKIIFQNGEKGILAQRIREQLQSLTGVNFDLADINDAIEKLVNVENKVHSKNGRHFIRVDYRDTIAKAVQESEQLHDDVIRHWFGKSATFSLPEGPTKLESWFENLMILFFKDYSYDWIKDLKPNRASGKKKTPNFENIIKSSFSGKGILEEDQIWLGQQFINFIESDRKEDDEILWAYGSCMFSATLLTARNYADELSLEVFRNSNFVLDTNILMILELEGFDKNYALDSIETTFEKLDIEPIYFHISKEEYKRALLPRRASTLAAIQEFDINVIKEMDCPFVRTAIRRGCVYEEDFVQFFDQISDVPKMLYDSLPLKFEDYGELADVIDAGQKDQRVKDGINTVFKRRTNREKREKPLEHDAGIYKGTEFLNKNKKSMILTRDSVLREYAFENAVRDTTPIAIGLDSLIQMMAINSGGAEFESTDFAPLFGRLVRESILPEKDAFNPVDLDFILKTRIQISELSNEEVVKIAKEVNKLRLQGVPDEDIVLQIQRIFRVNITGMTEEIENLKAQTHFDLKEKQRKDLDNQKLKEELFNTKYAIALKANKEKVNKSRLSFAGIVITTGLITWFSIINLSETDKVWGFFLSFAASLIASLLVWIFGFNKRMIITEADKEIIAEDVRKSIES